eukprot:scaffold300_cov258-Pinguiococcus_pyrenoidosus.AAC.46
MASTVRRSARPPREKQGRCTFSLMHIRNAPASLRCSEYASRGGGVKRCFAKVSLYSAIRRVMPDP